MKVDSFKSYRTGFWKSFCWKGWLTGGLALLFLTGCATRLPENIRTDHDNLTNFSAVMASPDSTEGDLVRWGGVIAEVRNRAEHSEIEVVFFTLRGTGRPYVSDQTPGRFRVRVEGFADPEVYARGRSITVLGTYQSMVEDTIDEFVYRFPLVRAQGVHLWPEEPQRVDVWHHDMYSPWYRHRLYGTGPYRVHPYYFPYGVRHVDDRRDQRPPTQQTPQQRPQMQREPVRQQH